VKPQVLQFLLDLVEVQSETSANSGASTSLDDDCLSEVTTNGRTDDGATNRASFRCDQVSTASEHTASKSPGGDGVERYRDSDPTYTGRCSVLETNGIDSDRGLSSKELHVPITSNAVTSCTLRGIIENDCSLRKSDNEEQNGLSSPDTSECELKPAVHNHCSAETSAGLSKINSDQYKCCKSDNSFSFASKDLSCCHQCCIKFDNAAEQEEHTCDRKVASNCPTASDDCQTQETSPIFRNSFNTKTQQHSPDDDTSTHEDTVADNHEYELAFLTRPPVKDLTWNTLTGTESSNEQLFSGDAQRPMKLQECEPYSSNEISAASMPIQPDRRNRTVSSSSDTSREGHIVSGGELSSYSVSRLFSNAWNALLLHIGLECVKKFNRSLLRSESGCDFQLESTTSKSDEDEGPCVRDADDPRTTCDGNAEENPTHGDGQSDTERCRSLSCFYCLQRFVDAEALQTHFERTHGQQQSLVQHHDSVVSESGLSSVSADTSSIVSSHGTSATGVWNRPPDSISSYFGGISPELLGLLPAVPPELMLPHLYAGSILPPAMMMMMMAAPFVDCPSSPLSNSLAALADPHACLLPSSATECRTTTYDDAAMPSVHQQSKRARTRISDSQLAVLRARFDINGPPNDDEIATIGYEVGLPSKVVKHWFRNTLFKERQRCKDSPYNFSVPPACDPPSASSSEKAAETATTDVGGQSADEDRDYERNDVRSDSSSMSTPATETGKLCSPSLSQLNSSTAQCVTPAAASEAPYFPRGCYFGVPYHHPPQALPLLPSVAPVPTAAVSGTQIVSMTSTSSGAAAHYAPPPLTTTQSRGGGHGKRASRTHFSDEQVRTLQEHFERNAYPRDDELESLSRRLGLSARVIVVWFQNARQKARRTYENHSSAAGGGGPSISGSKTDDGAGGPRYDCRSCGAAFQRYYELIKHQRSHAGCGSLVPSTSTTKYPAQISDTATVAAARHDSSQLRYDKPPSTNAASSTVGSPSCRQHYSHRRHQPHQPRVEAWYRPPVEGYVGAVTPRGPEVVNAVPVQHALPAVFPPHLPLVTSWNSATSCKEETTSCDASAGVDMTASLVEKKCDMKFLVDHTPPGDSAKNSAADLTDSGRQIVVRQNDDRRPLQTDYTARLSPKLRLTSTEETPYSNADYKPHDLTEALSSHLHRRFMASPTVPSSSVLMISGSSVEQHGRQLLGGGEMVATSLSPRRSVSLDSRRFGLSATAGENESPLDLSCQGKATSTLSGGDRSSEPLRETGVAEDVKQVGPVANGGDDSGSGTATSKSQPASGSSKRHRTHMSDVQVRVMRAIYADHRTPSIGECATLGAKIGLARRVVQVWFQNARAKDKKRCLTEGGALDEGSGPGDSDGGTSTAGDGRCRWCGVTYAVERCSVREHVFSPEHVAAVDRLIRASTDADRRGGAAGGRTGKRDHRRRLLLRTVTSNSLAAVSSSTLSGTSPTTTVARKFVYGVSLLVNIMTIYFVFKLQSRFSWEFFHISKIYVILSELRRCLSADTKDNRTVKVLLSTS